MYYFSEKIRSGSSYELSAQWTVHMKYHILFSLENTNKIKMSSAVVVNAMLIICQR